MTQQVVFAEGSRRRVVRLFREYLDELEDAGAGVPSAVRSFVSRREKVEAMFDKLAEGD